MIRNEAPEAIVTIDRPECAISGNGNLVHSLAARQIGTAYSTPEFAPLPGSTGLGSLDTEATDPSFPVAGL